MTTKKVSEMTKKEHAAWREKENTRRRLWKAQKKTGVKQIRPHLERLSETEKPVSHLKGKPLQFKEKPSEEKALRPDGYRRPLPEQRMSTKERFTWHRAERIRNGLVPEARIPEDTVDVVEEQVEKPMTTLHCPESIKEADLPEVRRSPEDYIEINMITKSRVIDSFYISSDKKKFHYRQKEYMIDEEAIYLLPTKSGFFVPSSYYKEGIPMPKGFKQTNRGITGKAMSLLYMEQLYTSLLYTDETKYNLFIVILSIASLIVFSIGLYLTMFYNGGVFPHPVVPMPPLNGGS